MQMPDRAMSAPATPGSRRAGRASGNVAAPGTHSGFTLIELVIAVTIIGIIAAIAYPSYIAQMQKSRRADATGTLMIVVNRQEQYLLDHKQYTDDMKKLGYADDPYITPEGLYSIEVKTKSKDCGVSPCYVFIATPVSGKPQAADAKCTSFSIDSAGIKRANGKVDNNCW